MLTSVGLMLTRVGHVLTRVGIVLTRVDLCLYTCIRTDLILVLPGMEMFLLSLFIDYIFSPIVCYEILQIARMKVLHVT